MDRRLFLKGSGYCATCATVFLSGDRAEARELPSYCSLDASFDVNRYRRMSQSGNGRLDRALIAEMRKLIQVFGINPGIQYIDDFESPNAFALNRNIISSTTGTILLGINLINSELSGEYGGAAVAGIAAHEGAHILQFYSSFGERLIGPTAKEMELHADYLSGYYFGVTGRTERSLLSFGGSLFAKGDYNYNDPGHHGTPDERLAAMEYGYQQYLNGKNLDDAVEIGVKYVHG